MADLIPIPFEMLLRRAYHEHRINGSIFDLPAKKFYRPDPALDLSVRTCGKTAGNPLGPAAGPHTQLAQNIALSWLGGARFIELKTVQIKDRLQLTRPCIDMATIGFNTEWSQELRLEESLREYVKAWMLVGILKHWLFPAASAMAQETVFDVSVGYDLAGIQSPAIRQWLNGMKNAAPMIEDLRREIPDEFVAYRGLNFAPAISDSITLSTFHGTPAGEIERICEFLIGEMGFHVIVKMNPPMLGKERLEELLYTRLGYTDLEVNPKAYDMNIRFPDAVAMIRRLETFAARHGRTVGAKFGNTLEVLNKKKFLKDDVQYLSGQPLHILHLALVDEWRKEFGPSFPISFSAGVDANNFADCVSTGMVPVTVCSDLLRPGGYGRMQQYLTNLERRMKENSCTTIAEFIVSTAKTSTPAIDSWQSAIPHNTGRTLALILDNPRYRAVNNARAPRKIGSHLQFWDCISCDKCIPVCPNDANFFFDVPVVDAEYWNIRVNGTAWNEVAGGRLTLRETHQIGTFADACNECGNCDVFCPEDGGPYIEKPRFFRTLESWKEFRHLSGFVLLPNGDGAVLHGRFGSAEYILATTGTIDTFTCRDGNIAIDAASGRVTAWRPASASVATEIDMRYYVIMKTLIAGVLDQKRVHFVNAGIVGEK